MREDLLTTFASACHLRLDERSGFKEWLLAKKGSYTVRSGTSSGYSISADSVGLARHLLVDVELLTNGCFEHLQEVFGFSSGSGVRSDAWNIVTVYYFSFYCAQTLLRLVGSPITYVNKNEASDLALLVTGGPSKSAGAGAYHFKRLTPPSDGTVEYLLKKSTMGRVHDAVWNALFSYLESVNVNSGAGNQEEKRILDFLTSKVLHSMYGNYSWPSELRNRANYWPGYIYRQVERKSLVNVRKLTTNWRAATMAELLATITAAEVGCSPVKKTSIESHVGFLYAFANTLFLLTRQLYSELLDRRLIDSRWELKRSKYKSSMSQPSANLLVMSKTY
ncbi:MAG: hypothetical protein JSS75_10930 [Bacteroidetes bacterium]|nr:hypothetical protein [Bacteroidota bacterium]